MKIPKFKEMFYVQGFIIGFLGWVIIYSSLMHILLYDCNTMEAKLSEWGLFLAGLWLSPFFAIIIEWMLKSNHENKTYKAKIYQIKYPFEIGNRICLKQDYFKGVATVIKYTERGFLCRYDRDIHISPRIGYYREEEVFENGYYCWRLATIEDEQKEKTFGAESIISLSQNT